MADTKGFSTKDELKTQDDNEFLAQLEKWHEHAKTNRQNFDWRWYLYANYRKGNHYVQFNRRTNQLVNPPRPRGQVRVVVNKIYSTRRSIINFATSYQPKWEVIADSTTEETVNNGMYSSKLLDYYYEVLRIDRKNRAISGLAFDYGIGYWQYGWDEEALGEDGQLGQCWVDIRDPFDVYLDPAGMETGDIQNCRYIDVAVSTPIQNVLDDPNYKGVSSDDIQDDPSRAASDFKSILLQSEYTTSHSSDKELGTVILHETMYKKRIEKEYDEDGEKKKIWVSKVFIASWIKGKLLRNEETEFEDYNLIDVPSDNNPNEIYGEGYIKNLIDLNKILNRLESQVVEYNNLVNRGRFIADKNSGMTKITNNTGEIIEKNAGAVVTALQPGGLSPDIHTQIQRFNMYIDDISGSQQAFRGDTPVGVTAGVALESLKAQSANNLQEYKDSIASGLERLGTGILKLVATKVVATRTAKRFGSGGKLETFKFKGQVGVEPNENIDKDTYIIGPNNRVKVTIGSNLAYTQEGRQARLDKLLEAGVIDQQTYLEHLNFGDVENIVKRSQQEQFNNAMLEGIKGGRVDPATGQPVQAQPPVGAAPAGPQGAPAGGQPQGDSWEKLADDENQAMLQGEDLPPTKGATREHTAIHIAWSQSDEVQQNEQLMQMLFNHIKGEEEEQGLTMPPQGAQQPAPAERGK